MPWASVDLILTDPPYLVNYRDRCGRSIANACDDLDMPCRLRPRVAEADVPPDSRVLRPDSLCVNFYGWNRADTFITA